MPELPEVQTVVTSLQKIVGSRISRIDLNRQDIVTPPNTDVATRLTNRRIASITRRAKRIVFALDNGVIFYIHLGMSGQLSVCNSDTEIRPHTHFVMYLADAREIRFRDPRRFGGLFFPTSPEVAHEDIGPEPLTLRPARLAILLQKTKRAIKVALLDQRLIAGLGNIYVDESLHHAGIHPLTPANKITNDAAATLSESIKLVLRKAIRHRGSSLRDYVDVNGESGKFRSRHQVYAREGKPCRRCKTPIQRIVLGGRSTHFCPKCQKAKRRRS